MYHLKELKSAVLLSLALFVVCGLTYPLALASIGQALMPDKAQGSLLYRAGEEGQAGKAVGSALVGQAFDDPRFLKGRPSSVGYNTHTVAQKADGSYAGVASGSNNFAATNPALIERVAADKQAFLAAHPDAMAELIPGDLLTASGSGLDPHISPASAQIQLPALARHTGLSVATLQAMVRRHTTGKLLGVFGGEGVHVLKVNMEIADALGINSARR